MITADNIENEICVPLATTVGNVRCVELVLYVKPSVPDKFYFVVIRTEYMGTETVEGRDSFNNLDDALYAYNFLIA